MRRSFVSGYDEKLLEAEIGRELRVILEGNREQTYTSGES
tara:strand:- start:1598 stop:1717 length:120 start_codon:yes stop_codon:yes gene_type:complete